MIKMFLDVTSTNTSILKCYYDAKRVVSKLGLKAKKIDYYGIHFNSIYAYIILSFKSFIYSQI